MADLKKLGRYELRSVLGKGAMGVVYEGFDPTLSRRVAVKTILKSVAHDDETERSYAERFVREAKAVARLSHPHIIQVHDFGVEGDVAYLVMEFIQGRELRDFFIAGERFEAGECIRIMGELLDALEFAHQAGVIHRDVKPANVMLDGQRRVKLADFGVARVQDSDRSAAGTMVGTPAFMSPEQISGGKVDRRSDIFSAGTILYQLLTGEQPFKGEGVWTVAKQIMQDDPPSPSSVVKSVSPAFDVIVDKALAKKVSDRYSSAREFAAALRGALGAPATPSAPAVAVQKPKAMPQTSDAELEFWRAMQISTDPAELKFYLEQFPYGTYAQLARHKLAKLGEPLAASRKETENTARLDAEVGARREAGERTSVVDADATVAIGSGGPVVMPPELPVERKKSLAIPAIAAAVFIVATAVGYLLLGWTPPPVPVAERVATEKAASEKATVERVALDKAGAGKVAVQEALQREALTVKQAAAGEQKQSIADASRGNSHRGRPEDLRNRSFFGVARGRNASWYVEIAFPNLNLRVRELSFTDCRLCRNNAGRIGCPAVVIDGLSFRGQCGTSSVYLEGIFPNLEIVNTFGKAGGAKFVLLDQSLKEEFKAAKAKNDGLTTEEFQKLKR